MDKLDPTTYKKVAKNNPNDLLEIVVGDSKQPDFKPQAKIERWDNEANISFRLKETPEEMLETPVVSDKKGKVEYKKTKREAHFYEVSPNEQFPDGAFETEIILLEKPTTNVVEFTLVDKDVEYFYQPELTPEEIEDGVIRPENVVGSYAVYAKSSKKNITNSKEYRAGKIGHVFRPRINDSAGTEVWGDLHIENGTLTVTIPQDFLDTATYPVKHAAGLTFGYTSAGASTVNLASFSNGDGRFGFAYDGVNGTIDSLSCYLSGVTANTKMILSLEDGAGANSHTQIVAPILKLKASTTSSAWNTYTASSESVSSANRYIPNVVGDSSSLGFLETSTVNWDTVGSTGDSMGDNTGSANYATPSSPWGPVVTSGTQKYSMYATYTASSGLTTNLISYWKLDEASGNAADSIGSNTLTNTGTMTYGTGIINNGASIATGKYLSISSAITSSVTNISVSLWADLSGTSLGGGFFRIGTSGLANGWGVGVGGTKYDGSNNGNNLLVLVDGVAWNSMGSFGGSGWKHVVVTRGASTWTAYVNGTALAGAPTSTPSAYLASTAIGADQGQFTGVVDEVGFWERELTSTEVTELYNSGAGLAYPFSTPSSNTTNFFFMS